MTGVIDVILGSTPLTIGVLLLVVGIALTLLSGLIDLAVYLAVAVGLLLLTIGALDVLGLVTVTVI